MKKQNTLRQRIIEKTNKKVTITIMVLVGILLIFSTYAWFSTNLNVRVKTFTMTVKKNTGLSISLTLSCCWQCAWPAIIPAVPPGWDYSPLCRVRMRNEHLHVLGIYQEHTDCT